MQKYPNMVPNFRWRVVVEQSRQRRESLLLPLKETRGGQSDPLRIPKVWSARKRRCRSSPCQNVYWWWICSFVPQVPQASFKWLWALLLRLYIPLEHPALSLMEGCSASRVAEISRVPKRQVKKILDSESDQLEVTKSLVNILYNIVIVGSIAPTSTQRAFFDKHSELVFQLVSKSRPLYWKKQELRENISLVLNIAASCLTVAGSY